MPFSFIERLSPERRASIFHFSVYFTHSLASVYLGIWLGLRGLSADEIGVVNAAPVLAMLAINVIVGRLADRAKDWRSVIIILALIGGAIPIGLFFVTGFWGILLIWTLTMVPAYAIVPVVDAATLRMTQRRGTDFAGIRGFGTAGFLAVTLLAGPLLTIYGDAAFVPLFVAMALLKAVVSLQLPQFRAQAGEKAAPRPAVAAGKLRDVLKPWFVAALLGLGVVYSTHSALGAFASITWKDQGIPAVLIGALVATHAASEATMMFLWKRLNIKASARHLILIACLVAAFRWTVMSFAPPIWVLFPLQALHSVTFAVSYFGGVYFIANWTSEDIAAEAQGFSFVIQQAMSVIALLGMGWFVGQFGNGAWLALGIYALLGAGLVLLSLRLKGPTAEPATTIPPVLTERADDLMP